MIGPATVSYTHLDVYKRQGILTVVIVIALETYAKDELSSLEF